MKVQTSLPFLPGIVASGPLQEHPCDMHRPLSPGVLFSLASGVLALYTVNLSLLCGFVAAFGFVFDALGILGNERNEQPSTSWELFWAGLADRSIVTDR